MADTLREQLAEKIYASFADTERWIDPLPLEKTWNNVVSLAGGGIAIECELDGFFRDAIDYILQELENMGHIFTEDDLNG